mmetsp:Transcript_14901/g.40765  ORF Transcript_14901/g.40765 Transcript_14901/m.40765 type:complete len:84 (-) Transcript_14901:257-508(-)
MGILHKKQSAEYLRLAVRTEAVAAKLEIAVKTQKVTSSMSQVTKAMGKVMSSMDLPKIQEIMDKFEKVYLLMTIFEIDIFAGI